MTTSVARISWVDAAKGIGIILVVVGHIDRGLAHADLIEWTPAFQFLDRWIYTFHMPLFFFLSGMFLVRSANKSYLLFFTEKLRTIAYPYFLWSAITIVLKAALGNIANRPRAIDDILLIFYSPIEQFWFLYVLFFFLADPRSALSSKYLSADGRRADVFRAGCSDNAPSRRSLPDQGVHYLRRCRRARLRRAIAIALPPDAAGNDSDRRRGDPALAVVFHCSARRHRCDACDRDLPQGHDGGADPKISGRLFAGDISVSHDGVCFDPDCTFIRRNRQFRYSHSARNCSRVTCTHRFVDPVQDARRPLRLYASPAHHAGRRVLSEISSSRLRGKTRSLVV